MILLSYFLLFFTLISTNSASISLSRSYSSEPVILSPSTTLHYQVNVSTNSINFGVFYNDSAIFSEDSAVWVGLGIGEASSGSMLGADIVTAQFNRSQLSSCSITDRYVPFTAYPLTVAPGPFPVADDCEIPDWTLVKCERDNNGIVLLEVQRPLIVTDEKQDRSILPGDSAILYAYGNEFGYHSDRRQTTFVRLYEEEGVVKNEKLPDDVDGSFDILATNYTIPSRDTTYACTSATVPLLGSTNQAMIVGVEPLIEASLSKYVHHFTVFLCSNDEYASQTKKTTACDGEKPPFGPLGNAQSQCSTFIYGYAKGVGRTMYPTNVGILVEPKRKYLVMESHFNNPLGEKGVVDSSGVRVYYTNKQREHQAGSLLVGDSLVQRKPRKIVSGYRYQHTCPSVCTERFSEPIYLGSSFLHMHTTGKEIYVNIFSENNTFIRNFNKVNFWSDSFQKAKMFEKPVQLNPGEQLQLSCVYDTSKRPNTRFGLRTVDEMCMEFILYWPLQVDKVSTHEINLCSFDAFRNESTGQVINTTICGDNGRVGDIFESPELFPFSINPAFNDTEGAPTDFGKDHLVCPTPSPLGSTTAEPTSPVSSPSADVPTPSSPIVTNVDPTTPSSSPSTDVSTPSSQIETTAEPSVSPSDSENVCFPSSAKVIREDGNVIEMGKLKVGDRVVVGVGNSGLVTSPVYMFTHFNSWIIYNFVRIETSGNKTIALTAGHLMHANGKLVKARNIIVGDKLSTINGIEFVKSVDQIQGNGLYNPQTIHGDIIVDGIVTSTFTEAVDETSATALLSPLRWLYKISGINLSFLFSSSSTIEL